MRINLFVLLLSLTSASIADNDFRIWREVAFDVGLTPETLYSIALVESRLISKSDTSSIKKVQAWPWTLNSTRYGGQFYDSREELIEDLNFLFSEGYTNIDIGIMQINWRYNGKRFVGDPIKLLDPETNIRTAGKLLKELMKSNNNDVFETVAKYHSYKKERGFRYAQKVINLSKRLKEQQIF